MAFSTVLLVSGSANFSTRDVWDGYRVALEAEGIRVIPYPTFSFLKVLSPEVVCNDIIGTALDLSNRIDCVLFIDGLYFRGPKARVPQSLRRAGIPTVMIATDDPYEPMPGWEDLYTYRYTNEIRCASNRVDYLPTATLPLPHAPRAVKPAYDVAFIGTVFEDRVDVLRQVAEFCEHAGRRFLIAGKFLGNPEPFQGFTCTEVRQRTIDMIEKWQIFSQTRVALNVFRQSEAPADSPSPRVFEVTAFGHAALLSGPRRAEVDRIFGDSIYHFDDPSTVTARLAEAWADDAERIARTEQAQRITLREHLYEHRAQTLIERLRDADADDEAVPEERIAWLIGCGRTGSTWLAEMLGDLPRLRRWHEPHFGRFLRHVNESPDDMDRRASFFFHRYRDVWVAGLRDLFHRMVRERYPQFGRHGLVVKEVNTPEMHPWLPALFPQARLILLVRDPFDVLDSYLDLQKPGSWNDSFGNPEEERTAVRARRTAEHIRSTMLSSLQAFDQFPIEQRLQLTYEELRSDPVPALLACGKLLAIDIDAETARQSAARHDFDNYEVTGPQQFRRQGKVGAWQTSPNFTSPIHEIADEVLGPLRGRLGYSSNGVD